MFHLKLLINLAPLSIAGQIEWHALEVMIIWCGGVLPKPREKAQALLQVGLSPALITVFSALNFQRR